MRVDDIRKDYEQRSLRREGLPDNPYAQFQQWLEAVFASAQLEPTAMVLATVGEGGMPSARVVLLKGHDEDGLLFYTNYTSRKARELERGGLASLCFFWGALERQVRVEGAVERATAEESDSYFSSRPRGSQVGAWASPQSVAVSGREALDERVTEIERRFDGQDVPRPDFWGGYRLRPRRWEFWQGRRSRLHDRFVYTCEDGLWRLERLGP